MIEVKGHVVREIRVHPYELTYGHFNNLGNFMVLGGRDHGKIFLSDTKTSKQMQLASAPGTDVHNIIYVFTLQ